MSEVGADVLERLRSAYRALGPGFPPEAVALFAYGGDDGGGAWYRLAPRGQRRRLATAEMTSNDLFSMPPNWEVMRVELRRLNARRGLVTASGFMRCRPRGTWENLRIPFLHTWTMRDGKALTFQNFLDSIELRRADERDRRAS